MRADGGDSAEALKRFAEAGVDVAALAAQLQEEGAKSFVASWRGLMDVIASKSESSTRRGDPRRTAGRNQRRTEISDR